MSKRSRHAKEHGGLDPPKIKYGSDWVDKWNAIEYKDGKQLQESWATSSLQDLPWEGDEQVLDIGCGDGKITATMAQLLPRGSVVGLDISPDMIFSAIQEHEKACQAGNLFFLVQGDASDLDFNEKFNLVTSFTVFHWLRSQEAALRGIYKALVNGGHIWLEIPVEAPEAFVKAVQIVHAKFDVPTGPIWRFDVGWCKEGNWQANSEEEYRQFLSNTGFQPILVKKQFKSNTFHGKDPFLKFVRNIIPHVKLLEHATEKTEFLEDFYSQFVQLSPDIQENGDIVWKAGVLRVHAAK